MRQACLPDSIRHHHRDRLKAHDDTVSCGGRRVAAKTPSLARGNTPAQSLAILVGNHITYSPQGALFCPVIPSMDKAVVEAVAGGIGTLVASCATYPLKTIYTLQVGGVRSGARPAQLRLERPGMLCDPAVDVSMNKACHMGGEQGA